MFNSSWSKVAVGFVLGTVGVPLLKTKEAQKVYRVLTAGALIAKDRVLEEAENIQAMAMDIHEDAKVMVEEYYMEKDAQYDAEIAGDNADDTDDRFVVVDEDAE